MLVIGNPDTFATDIAPGPGIVLIGADFNDPIIFNHHLQSTTLEAETATGLLPRHN
jgi:hypothetical protein